MTKRSASFPAGLAVDVTPEQKQAVKQAAAKEGLSTSEWIRRALDESLQNGTAMDVSAQVLAILAEQEYGPWLEEGALSEPHPLDTEALDDRAAFLAPFQDLDDPPAARPGADIRQPGDSVQRAPGPQAGTKEEPQAAAGSGPVARPSSAPPLAQNCKEAGLHWRLQPGEMCRRCQGIA